MTKNAEVRLEDLYHCQHEPQFPICDREYGVVVAWKCRCGRIVRHGPDKGPTSSPDDENPVRTR